MAGIVLTIEVDDKGTVKVKQFTDETKKAFDEMKKGPEQARAPMASIQESWVGLTAKVTLATGAIYGVTRALSSFVEEAAQAEQIENRLRFALETIGYTWQYAKSAVDQFANSIQESTRFSDEQARQSLTDMMMYTNDFAKAQTGAKLAMDMSIRTGQDLTSTSRLIGMAMSGNVEMLGRYIPQLRNLDERLGSNATNAQKAEYAMKVLNEKFGGTAQADINSYAGSVAKFKNAWSDLKETIGTAFLPVLKETFEWITKIIKAFQGFSAESASQKFLDATIEKFKGRIEELKEISNQPGLVAFQKEMIANQISALEEEIRKLEAVDQKRQDTAKKLIGERKADIFPKSPKTFEDLYGMTEEELKDRMSISKLMHEEWKERTLAPVTFEDLYGMTEEELKDRMSVSKLMHEDWRERNLAPVTFENIYGMTEEELKDRMSVSKLMHEEWLENYTQTTDIENAWISLSKNIGSAWDFNVTGILRGTENIGDAFKNMADGMVDAFVSAITKMIAQWALFGSITGEKKSGGGFLYGGSWGGLLGGITSLFTSAQEGGVFTKPTPILIGDAGDEAAVPLKGGKIPIEGNAGGDIYIINYNQVNDPNTFERIYGPVVKKLSAQSAAEAKRLHRK